MIGHVMQKSLQWTLILVAFLLATGCISRSAPTVNYYSLMTLEQLGDTETIAALPEVRLGVGPITIPDSLKRSQIATRQQGNRYEFAEFNRWAGVLERDITAVMGDNLGQLLGVEKVGFFPWMQHFKPTYRVMVDVVRFDGSLQDEAVLIARWAVADNGGKDFLAGRKSDYRQPLADASFAALIKAESQLLAALSKEIAAEIVALEK
ncbi:MAG: PqiC family protein [Desulfuromonadales bacterium]